MIVVLGPTGSGKTALGVDIAVRFGAPVLSADSRQVYRGMAIGTAQPDAAQLAAAKHYFIASHDVTDDFSCAAYEREALELLNRLFSSHNVVVAVGGSGLYIDALCQGMDPLPDADPRLRAELMVRLDSQGLESLSKQLGELDPGFYATVDRSNPRRVLRALEICLQTGRPYSELRSGKANTRDFETLKIGVMWPREVLYERIDRRVDEMVASGLEHEVRRLSDYREVNALQTVGYREMFDYIDGRIDLEEAVRLIKRNSRRYAKRQMTWFRRDGSIHWIAPGDEGAAEKLVENFVKRQK